MNESCESQVEGNAAVDEEIKQIGLKSSISYFELVKLVVGDFGLTSSDEGKWRIQNITLEYAFTLYFPWIFVMYNFVCREAKESNARRVQRMIQFAKELEKVLPKVSDDMGFLCPALFLVGSIAEGTRIGLANELDLSVEFRAFNGISPFRVKARVTVWSHW